VLEDFKPFAHQKAIQQFYSLLRWLNGPTSPFETNDCGLRPPRTDHEVPIVVAGAVKPDPIVIHGRMTVLYRHLSLNTSEQHVIWLKQTMHGALRDRVQAFPAVIFIGTWPHWFLPINKQGQVISLRYWAWGDDEAAAFHNLGDTYQTLNGLFEWLAAILKVPPPESGAGQRT
jgi:hypothetical protein